MQSCARQYDEPRRLLDAWRQRSLTAVDADAFDRLVSLTQQLGSRDEDRDALRRAWEGVLMTPVPADAQFRMFMSWRHVDGARRQRP